MSSLVFFVSWKERLTVQGSLIINAHMEEGNREILCLCAEQLYRRKQMLYVCLIPPWGGCPRNGLNLLSVCLVCCRHGAAVD